MAEAKDRLWRAAKKLVLQGIGISPSNPYYQHGQTTYQTYATELSKLPQVQAPEIMDMDPASPTYGHFYFMVDYSVVDGPDIIV